MTVVIDDRTPAQQRTHTLAVVGTDSFMSGWGEAKGGLSYAAWACTPETVDEVEQRIKERAEMKRVRVVRLAGYRAKGAKHLHIYVVDEEETC